MVTTRRAEAPGPLGRLARLHGVHLEYRDASGAVRASPAESVVAVLRSLGAPLPGGRMPSPDEVEAARRLRRRELWERVLPPVVVAPGGRLPPLPLRLPARGSPDRIELRVRLESGEEVELAEGPTRTGRAEEVDGRSFVLRRTGVRRADGRRLPWGLHRLLVRGSDGMERGEPVSVHLLSAPRRCWRPEEDAGRGAWGVFLPLYALRTRGSAGVGDYEGLGRLGSWAAGRGASWLGTLPLLPTFLDEPFDPSPYAPVSRLFWSELYLDPADAVRRTGSAAAASWLDSAEHRRRARTLEAGDEVDYRAAAALRRELLDRAARDTGGGDGAAPLPSRLPGLGRWLEGRPEAGAYARFRAATGRAGAGWTVWDAGPRDAPLRGEALRPGRDFDPEVRDRWLLAAWLADEQVGAVARRGERDGFGLYLDLPLSVHPDGFDVWRRRELFARDMSVGAPPDAFFREGQDWGFPPPVPHARRRSGYAYLGACLDHSMGRSAALRVDHVMGCHRLFWIPRGAGAAGGVYVRYPAREAWALLALASHRHRTEVVGEDLGTVPPAVRRAMDRHAVARYYVVPFEISPDRTPPVAAPPEGSVATLDTHDTWPFAGWWEGRDIDGRLELGMLDEEEAAGEREGRRRVRAALVAWLRERGDLEAGGEPEPRDVMLACLDALGRSAARAVVLNLEDAWLERRPQNVPGSPGAARSWRGRAAWRLDEVTARPEVADVLRRIEAARRGAPAGRAASAAGGAREETRVPEGGER